MIPKRATLLNGMLGIVGSMIMIIGAMYSYSAYVESPYLYYQNLPFPPTSEAHAGKIVELSVERCSRSTKTEVYHTTHTLVNVDTKEMTLLPDVEVSIEPGCHRNVSRINRLPLITKPGKYYVSGIATVDGLFVKKCVPWYSEQFEIKVD